MKKMTSRLDRVGEKLVDGFQLAGLFVLGATIVWAAAWRPFSIEPMSELDTAPLTSCTPSCFRPGARVLSTTSW